MKPYKATPILKERLWGGQKLKNYNKSFETGNIGESWETDKDSMPVLIKLIDAKDILSIQVHPDDRLAWELEGQQKGKSEAWIVLECDEGAELVAGIKNGTSRRMLEEALKRGNIQQYLNIIKVKKGDCLYIPAGTVHSLGAGIMVYEVQQPSDITYRLYDWNRTDEGGNPRELHIDKALQSIDFEACQLKVSNIYDKKIDPLQKYTIFQNEHFTTSYIKLEQKQRYDFTSHCFAALTCISGSAHILDEEGEELIRQGDTWILPNSCKVGLCANEGLELIVTEHF